MMLSKLTRIKKIKNNSGCSVGTSKSANVSCIILIVACFVIVNGQDLSGSKSAINSSQNVARNFFVRNNVNNIKQQQQQQTTNNYETKTKIIPQMQSRGGGGNIRDSEQQKQSKVSLVGSGGADDKSTRTTSTSSQERVIPSYDTNGNSQVVYVNLARVVSDKNETERAVGGLHPPIKLESSIACGETNRLGQPSLKPSTTVNNGDSVLNRIVGGNKADPGEFPFQVRLNIRSRRGSSLCGGVIIDKRHILTAAHCMTTCSSYFVSTSTIEPSAIQATIGDLRITVPDGEQTIGIEKVTAHQQYSACSYSHNNYDIAILKTSRPMTWVFTKDGFGSVNRACLPHPNDEYEVGENATVSGWGVMTEGEGTISNVLNAVEVPIVSYDECKAAYGQRVNKDHVCAGLKQGGRDSCQGDSGGPLVRIVKGQAELIGIVSFGYGCAQANSPGVYTKVSHYIDWIEKNL